VAKKAKNSKIMYRNGDLWIAPSLSFKQPQRQSDWKLQRVEPTESSRVLELADIALGLKPAKSKMKRGAQK
jgi:hypothetical protein